jgi:hypothetical protein
MRARSLESIGHAIPGALAELLREQPPTAGKIDFAWKAAVGPSMGRVTAVRLVGDTLLVDAQTAAWGREISRSSAIILRRLHTLLGDGVVRKIDVRR